MTQGPDLSRLEREHVREIWADEARDFTPWLARPENIELLGEVIGIELEVEGQEQSVGPFKADILCKDADSNDDHFVLIENQLERTDHSHLGQLMTYAAGLNAVSIVWIADRFTEEHRAALDWLNEITAGDFHFFGLEIEVWRIGESPAAPKFNVVSSPNDWTAGVSRAAKSVAAGQVSALKQQQKEYWAGLWELLDKVRSPLTGSKPQPRHWTNFAIGRSKFKLDAVMNSQKHFIQAGLYISASDAAAYFELLRQDQAEIEGEFGSPLDWRELPNKKASRIVFRKSDVDPTDRDDWQAQHTWFRETLEKLDRVFRPRVGALDLDDLQREEDEE